jgi:tetratricopeptide (TPR) repeat protein
MKDKMKKQAQSNAKIWIVKASESLLGPYTIAELALAVRSKQIGLLDEAKNNKSRWVFIRDLPELQSAVLELANEADTVEKTHTAAHTQVSITRRVDDDLTPTPPRSIPFQSTVVTSPPVQEKVIPSTTTSKKPEPIRSYGTAIEKEPIPLTKWLLSTFVGISFLIALFAFIQRQNWDGKQKKVWTQVQQLYAAKLYDRAYQVFKDYQQEVPSQPLAMMRLGFLHLNQGRELVKAKRLFESATQLDPKNKELMMQSLNGLALVSLYDSQPQVAKIFLERAQLLEPGNIPTKINRIAYLMSQSNWNEALNIVQQLMAFEPRKAHLLHAILVELSGNRKSEIPGIINALESSADQSLYLKAEMKLMSLRLAITSGDSQAIASAAEKFFTELPSFSMNFSEDPSIDQRWRDWNFLYQFCADFGNPFETSAEGVAVRVICMSKVQRWAEAEKLLNESFVRFPSHEKLLLAQLHLLTAMGRWPEVRALNRVPQLQQKETADWYFAKTCLEEKQDKCVESTLNPLLQRSIVKTYVYELKASQQCSKKPLESCRFILSQGLSQDPLSIHLLSIRYDLEESL